MAWDADQDRGHVEEQSGTGSENNRTDTLVSEPFFSLSFLTALFGAVVVTALVVVSADVGVGLVAGVVFVLAVLVFRKVFTGLVCTECGYRVSRREVKQCPRCALDADGQANEEGIASSGRDGDVLKEFVQLPENIEPEKIYTIRTYNQAYQAKMSRDILAHEGIVAFIPGAEHNSILGMYGSGIDIPLKVHGRDAKEAIEFLSSLEETPVESMESDLLETVDPDKRKLWSKIDS